MIDNDLEYLNKNISDNLEVCKKLLNLLIDYDSDFNVSYIDIQIGINKLQDDLFKIRK